VCIYCCGFSPGIVRNGVRFAGEIGAGATTTTEGIFGDGFDFGRVPVADAAKFAESGSGEEGAVINLSTTVSSAARVGGVGFGGEIVSKPSFTLPSSLSSNCNGPGFGGDSALDTDATLFDFDGLPNEGMKVCWGKRH
jgi:hypothetical protein